ncbi:CvpA family protein [Haloplasma contractile]|uniref:Uncharacterized protein n=1 Tax=Haloplasma contractile SSD-17B TaxID=1033810 RepID=U2DU69_9MOLU|nr:CvpA family protein [Haloplasma contractile]ERJ11977.1 hypothetical protein HLPCO_001891 [Haloplasma contractile SSD-17B]
MGLFDGIINFSLFFIILLVGYNLIRTYRKSQKALLFRTLVSLASLIVCTYLIFDVEQVFRLHDVLTLYNLPMPILIIIVAFIFCYLSGYLLIGRLLKFILKLMNGLKYFRKHSPFHQKLNFFLIFIRKLIFISFIITIASVIYNPLYTSGITKPIVDLPIVTGTQTELIHDLDYINNKNKEIDTFLSLFSSDDLKESIRKTADISREIKAYEDLFMNNVFPNLTKEQKSEIDQAFYKTYERDRVDDYSGILTVISNEKIFSAIFENNEIEPKGFKQYVKFLSTVMFINDLLFEEKEIAYLECKNYVKDNKELIRFINNEQYLIEELDAVKDSNQEDEVVEALVKHFSEHQTKLQTTTYKKNRQYIDDIANEINHYYFMTDWATKQISEISGTMNTGAEYSLIDVDVYEAMRDAKTLDYLIENYNKDYQENHFKKLSNRRELKTSYQYTNDYLDQYRIYSKSLNVEIDPDTRLKAAIIHEDINIENYLYNQVGLELLLNEINANEGCKSVTINYQTDSATICRNEKVYDTMDAFLWGYLITYDDVNEQYRVSNEKVSMLFRNIEKMSPDKQSMIESELKELNNQLLFSNSADSSDSYIEMYYEQSIIGYDVMKLLYKNETYTSGMFNEKIEDIIK